MLEPVQYANEAPKLPNTPIRFALYFIKSYALILFFMFILEAGQAACQMSLSYAFKNLIDAGTQFQGTFDEVFTVMKSPITFFVSLSVGILLFSRASGTLLVILGPMVRRRVRKTLYEYLQFHSQKFFLGNFAGSIANRVSEVAMGVNHSLWTVLFDFWPVMVSFSMSIFLLYSQHHGLAILLASWVLVYIGVSFLLATRCQVYAKAWAATRSMVTGKIVDSVTNILNSKLFAREDFERDYLVGYLDSEVKAARKTLWFMEGMRWFQFIATMCLQIAMIGYSLKYWVNGEITVGAFAMACSLSLMVINDARGLSRRFLEFFEYLGNISDGISVIVRSHEVLDAADSKPCVITRAEVEYKDVQFGYSDGLQVFDGLNLKIQSGERVGLVGFSGSGKTTFVNLLLRMYDLQGGQILIDGQDIAKCTQNSLRSQIAMIPQEPMLFHRSLMENIRYGKEDATDEQVIEAAKHARAHDFIIRLPEGYKSLVGERGVKLSGGQRQRIAIARAILKNAPILVMDEATSSLDSVTEKSIQSSLKELMNGKTVLVIAHRLSTISHLNRIIVFDKGKIVEDGTHEELLARKGHYSLLWSMQVGGFLPSSEKGEESDLLASQ